MIMLWCDGGLSLINENGLPTRASQADEDVDNLMNKWCPLFGEDKMRSRVSAGLFCVALCALMTAEVHAADKGAFLAPNQSLVGELDEQISTSEVRFVMQHDCNLVAYHGSKPVWATNTNGKGSHCVAIMQHDGNLVLLRGGDGKVLWSSRTDKNPGAWLSAQWDGNVVIYPKGQAKAGRALWATNTVIPRSGFVRSGGNGVPNSCAFSRTNMKCIAVVQFCQTVWSCGTNPGSLTPVERSDAWVPCGACVGFKF